MECLLTILIGVGGASLKARATDLDKKYYLADENQKALTLPTVSGKWVAHKTGAGFTAQPFFN